MNESARQFNSPQGEKLKQGLPAQAGEQEKKGAVIILRYLDSVVSHNQSADQETEESIKEHYSNKSVKEKVDELYQKMMIFAFRRQDKAVEDAVVEVNPKLISRIKILLTDSEVRKIFSDKYGEARAERLSFRGSDLMKKWHDFDKDIIQKTKRLTKLRQDIFQKRIKNKTDEEEIKSEIAELEEAVNESKQAQAGIISLEGQEKTAERTDAAALLHYEVLNKYRDQLDEGFVWLPSREEIDAKAMSVLESGNPKQTRRGIFFISEPGTGKSEQIRAIARRLTGMDRVKISCGPRTGEPQLLGQGRVFPGATEIEKGTFTDYTKAVSGAWTGYDYSYQEKPIRPTAQVVELDEMPKVFENETFFTIAKGFFALKDGDVMPGTDKKILPGRILIGSGNIGQHHGPKAFPPALEREFIVIPVDYPEMKLENPELYEFMLAGLLEKGGLQPAKKELMPYYQKHELPEEQRKVLADGSIVVATDKLVEDASDRRHGFLYRLAYAVKAIQNSYMARGGENAYIDYTKRDILRYKDNDDGSIFVAETGSQIILGTTITLNDLNGWMSGYKEQARKKKALNLSKWLQEKLREKVGEKHEDRDKLRAIFDHFHLFDEVPTDFDAEPLTPKEIGYLSPRVPRPVYVEKPAVTERPSVAASETKAEAPKVYETKDVVLVGGSKTIKIKAKPF